MEGKKKMRLATCCLSLIITGFMPLSAQNEFIAENTISLKQALEQIENSTHYKIAYNESQLDVNQKVDFLLTNGNVFTMLNNVLKNTGFTYKVKDNYIVMVPLKQNQSWFPKLFRYLRQLQKLQD